MPAAEGSRLGDLLAPPRHAYPQRGSYDKRGTKSAEHSAGTKLHTRPASIPTGPQGEIILSRVFEQCTHTRALTHGWAKLCTSVQ
eukprot:10602353-Alexandrium_andersonii.AAC.1